MSRAAIVTKTTGIIQNMIVATASDPWSDEKTYLVDVPSDLLVSIGHTYNGTNFIDFDGNLVTPIQQDPIAE
jgi:hypothetical protein